MKAEKLIGTLEYANASKSISTWYMKAANAWVHTSVTCSKCKYISANKLCSNDSRVNTLSTAVKNVNYNEK